jgi:type VI secretion system protein VasD
MTMHACRWPVWAFAVLTAVLALATHAKRPPPQLLATVTAAADINPDGTGSPSPVVLRYYQLRTLTAFENADFFTLYENAATVLAADQLGAGELRLRPGDTLPLNLELNPETRFIAIVVAYQAIDQAQWRASFPIVSRQITAKNIALAGTSVEVTDGKLPRRERRR